MNKSRDTDCLFFCFVALTFVFLAWCTLPVPSVQAEEQPTITIGVYENKPKIFTDAQGKPTGIFIDIIETIAKEEGWRLRYKSGIWGEGLDRLAKAHLARQPDLKCLFMSGFAAWGNDEHEMATPGTHFLQKPFSDEDLLAKVREALDGPGPSLHLS